MSGALLRFRVVAWVVGAVLVFFLCVAVPLRYLGGEPRLSELISPVHGIVLYPLYLVVTANLAVRRRWSLVRTLGVMLAGTVPFLSFVVERRVTHDVAPVGGLRR